MKIYTAKAFEGPIKDPEEEKFMKEYITHRKLHTHGHPIPPHERKSMVTISFDESDMAVFRSVFQNEDEAVAASEIIKSAPPEIQILAAQLIYQIGSYQTEKETL